MANLFAISSQSKFSSDFKTIEYVGDSGYTSFNGVSYDLNSFSVKLGETTERTIMFFLYQLWDEEKNNGDNISISDADLWTIMVSNNPEFFYSFVNKLYYSEVEFSRGDLGLLLETFKLSSSSITYSVSIENDYSSIPTFTWEANGTDIYYKGKTYEFSYDTFDLTFYNANFSTILTKYNISRNKYTLLQSDWNSILKSSGTKYYLQIKSYDTLGLKSGPYFSNYYEFQKPSQATQILALNNIRYFEKKIAIAPNSYWYFDLTFDRFGTKLIQTFGTADTKLWLYDSDGTTLLKSDDDSGYSRNALIYKALQANKKYVLKVGLYNNSIGAETRLSIAPIYGAQDSNATNMENYDNFVNINTYPNFTWAPIYINIIPR